MKNLRKWSVLPAIVLATGCGNGTAPGNGISLSFSSRNPAVTAVSPVYSMSGALGDTLRNGTDVLILDKVEIVLKQIELKNESVADCDAIPRPAGCLEFKSDPMVIDLPLGTGAQQTLSVDVPPGRYDEVDFEIHKLTSGDSRDATLRAQRPDLVDRSIKVQGKFNGVVFTYESDLDVEQEIEFSQPLVVTAGGPTNLTVRITAGDWFKTAAGALVNPATANKGGANEGLVKENIKKSVKVFEDKDRDGDDRDG